MGKDWDRLDGVGTGGATFSSDGMGKGFKTLPSYGGSPNPLCRNCKGSKRGRDRKGFRVCRCDAPDFPNIASAQGRRMSDWHLQWLTEAHRVIRPGGVIKAFSATRTFHRLAAAMEDAGFVRVHLEAWTYGSGFPKSLNVAKAFDKAAGKLAHEGKNMRDVTEGVMALRPTVDARDYVHPDPITPEAVLWKGWGTSLKPAWEPVVVGVRP